MASSLFFNGRQYVSPATVSAVDDTAMVPVNPSGANNLAILGISDAGQPGVLIKLNSPTDAKNILRGGELLTAARKAFGPSAATGGPRTITVVRVGGATQASLTLKDASGGDSLVLTSKIYGLPANQTMAKVEPGTSGSGLKVTVQNNNVYYAGDNLQRAGLTVQYVGADAVATVGVTATGVVLKAGADTASATTAAVSIDYADFGTVQQVVDRINTIPGFSATAAAASALNTSNTLDFVTDHDVKAAAYTVAADLQAVQDFLNSSSSTFVTAARAAGAGSPPVAAPFAYLTGATATAPTLEDWTDGLDVLETADVQRVVPLSGDPSVHAATDAHVQYMSTAGRRERRAVVGGLAGLDTAGVMLLPRAIASDRTSFAWPAHIDYDTSGNGTLQPGYMTAVVVAGAQCGVNPGVSLTNKALSLGGLEFDARNPADTDDLISAGVLVIENTPTGYKVCRDISTWLSDNNYNRVENACGAAVDYVVSSVRTALDVLRGGQSSPRSLARALSIAQTCLDGLAKPAPVGPGVIVGDANSPAYTNLTSTVTGDVIGVAFECSPVIPDNFVTVGVSIVPYSGTASLAS